MDKWMDRWMDGWIMDGWIGGTGWKGWVDGSVGGWMDGAKRLGGTDFGAKTTRELGMEKQLVLKIEAKRLRGSRLFFLSFFVCIFLQPLGAPHFNPK